MARRAHRRGAEAAAHGCAASSSGRDASRSSTTANVGGRPPIAQIDESELRWLCGEGYGNIEIAQYFGTTPSAIDHKKRRLGLTQQRKVELPPLEVLEAVWAEDPRTSVAFVAAELGVSANTLRRHFRSVGFTPMEPHGCSGEQRSNESSHPCEACGVGEAKLDAFVWFP